MFPPDELLNCREENVKRNNNILHASHHVQFCMKIFPPSYFLIFCTFAIKYVAEILDCVIEIKNFKRCSGDHKTVSLPNQQQ